MNERNNHFSFILMHTIHFAAFLSSCLHVSLHEFLILMHWMTCLILKLGE